MRDTIVAIATATGGGVGMVRLSGPQALAVAGRVFRPMNPAKSPETMPGLYRRVRPCLSRGAAPG